MYTGVFWDFLQPPSPLLVAFGFLWKWWNWSSFVSEPVKFSPEDPDVHLPGRPGDTTLAAAAAFEGETTQTGPGESTGTVDFMMDAKSVSHGGDGRGPARNFDDFFADDFLTATTGTSSNRHPAHTAAFIDDDVDNNKNVGDDDDDGDADDLRLDDFIGVTEMENNDNESLGGTLKSSLTSSSSSPVRQSKKLLRKKKHAAVSSSSSPSSSSFRSPLIVVEGVDGRAGEEEEVEVEGVTLKDVGNEKGEEEDDDDLTEEVENNGESDADMDFGVLEVVSSHLNVDVSKQKTSLRKKGSLARRKRPTRHTVTLPTGASDNIFVDSTDNPPGNASSQSDVTDDVDSGKQTILDSSSSDPVDAPRKFVPCKPPMMVPGLQDLTQSRLFNKERQKKRIDDPSSPATTTPASAAEDNGTTLDSILGSNSRDGGAGPDPVGPGGGGSRGKSLYKKPVWLSEMKAKTSTPDTKAKDSCSNTNTNSSSNIITSSTKTSSSNSSSTVEGSAGKTDEGLGQGLRPGLRKRGVSPGVAGRAGEEPQPPVKPEKPAWMKTALEKTSRVADTLQGQKDNQENREKEDDDNDKQAAPPWAAELKRKNRPLVGIGQISTGNNQNEGAATPSKMSSDTREREEYTPSWANRNQLTNTSSPRDSGKGKATNGSTADVRGPQGSPVLTGEIPRWKLELAERKKRRQSGQSGTAGSSDGRSDTSSNSSTAGGDTTDASPSLPAWRQQLKSRKQSLPPSERSLGEGESSPSPDWARQVEERRARLMKSGLLGEAGDESHC